MGRAYRTGARAAPSRPGAPGPATVAPCTTTSSSAPARPAACSPPAQRGSGRQGRADRGRPAGPSPRSTSRRCSSCCGDRRSTGTSRPSPSRSCDAADLPAARQGARRLAAHQRDGLHPRPPRATTTTGRGSATGLELRRAAALLQAQRGQRARRVRVPRRRWPAARLGPASRQPALEAFFAAAPRPACRQRRLQRRRAGRRGPVPARPARRRALERGRAFLHPTMAART